MDYSGNSRGDWASFVDDRGAPYWVHPATGEATYSNPSSSGFPTQNDVSGSAPGYYHEGGHGSEGYVDNELLPGRGGYDNGGYSGDDYGEGEGYIDDSNNGYGYEGYGNESISYLGGNESNDNGWCERKRISDAVGLAAAGVKASQSGMAPGMRSNNHHHNSGTVADSTSLAFDHSHELLWIGRADGSVSSFALDNPGLDGGDAFVVSNRYCAFKQCAEGSVLALASLQPGPLSLSQHRVRIHARGGFALCEAPADLAARSSPLSNNSSQRHSSTLLNNRSTSNNNGSNSVANAEGDLPPPRVSGGENGSHGWKCMRQLDGLEHRLAVGAASGLLHVLDMHQVGVARKQISNAFCLPGPQKWHSCSNFSILDILFCLFYFRS